MKAVSLLRVQARYAIRLMLTTSVETCRIRSSLAGHLLEGEDESRHPLEEAQREAQGNIGSAIARSFMIGPAKKEKAREKTRQKEKKLGVERMVIAEE